jgi:hypothetical protein
MFDEALAITGRVTLELLDEHGRLKDFREIENLVTNTGKAAIAGRMVNPAVATHMTHMAVGSGSTAPAASDVALAAEIVRVALATAGGTLAGAVVTYAATFAPGIGTGALQEAGIFNAPSGVSMQNRTTFAVINKAAGDTLNVTWTVTVG